jgi:hypothetical protein
MSSDAAATIRARVASPFDVRRAPVTLAGARAETSLDALVIPPGYRLWNGHSNLAGFRVRSFLELTFHFSRRILWSVYSNYQEA